MTKSELIEAVAAKAPRVPKRDVEAIVNTMFDAMTDALAHRQRIEIRGLGSFVAKERRARDGRNPRTGEKVSVPHKWVPFFTVGKELRERVNALTRLPPDEDEAPATRTASTPPPALVPAGGMSSGVTEGGLSVSASAVLAKSGD